MLPGGIVMDMTSKGDLGGSQALAALLEQWPQDLEILAPPALVPPILEPIAQLHAALAPTPNRFHELSRSTLTDWKPASVNASAKVMAMKPV